MLTENLFHHWAQQCNPALLAEAKPDLEVLAERIKQYPAQENPIFIHMMGEPGSGKTTVAQAIFDQLDKQQKAWFWHDFDRVIDYFSGYHADYKNSGAEAAFAKWESVARAYGYKFLGDLVQKRTHILFDHGGTNKDHPALLNWIKAQGYKVIIVAACVDKGTAERRVKARNESDGERVIPLSYATERRALTEKMKPTYRTIADAIVDVDNNGAAQDIDISAVLDAIRA